MSGLVAANFPLAAKRGNPQPYYTLTASRLCAAVLPPGILAAMAEGLSNVHLSDGNGGIPQEGCLDGIAALLEARGYNGPVILEAYGTRVENLAHLVRGWEAVKKAFPKKTGA